MCTMFKKPVAAVVIVLALKLGSILSHDSCQLTDKPHLQIAFVVAYSQNRRSNYMRFQTETAKYLMKSIQVDFPATEFSVVGFLDYPDIANPRRNARSIHEAELCYIVTQQFTTQSDKILDAIARDKTFDNQKNYYGDDEQDSVTTAMLFAAVDPKLKWNSGFYVSKGKIVRKIMILMTWRKITKTLENPGTRTVPKADGSDNCSTAIPPTFDQLSSVLLEHNFAIINAINNIEQDNIQWLTDEVYSKEFANIYVPYYPVPYPAPGKKARFDGTGNRDYSPYADQLFTVLKKEVLECDWEDPIGYNSLGL